VALLKSDLISEGKKMGSGQALSALNLNFDRDLHYFDRWAIPDRRRISHVVHSFPLWRCEGTMPPVGLLVPLVAQLGSLADSFLFPLRHLSFF